MEQRSLPEGTVRSNVITVSVTSPTGDEAAVLTQIEANAEARLYLSYQDLGGLLPECLRGLASDHPSSVYLRRALYRDLQLRATVAQNGCDATDTAPCAVAPEERSTAIRKQAARLLTRAVPLLDVQDEWLPDLLRIVAQLERAAGNDERSDAMVRQLARDHPDRAAGRWAADLLEP